MLWIGLTRKFDPQSLGYLPNILLDEDPRTAREQLDARYAHGGGWRPISGFSLDRKSLLLRYPGDPPYHPVAMAKLHEETVIFYYPCELLMVLAADGSFEVTRVD